MTDVRILQEQITEEQQIQKELDQNFLLACRDLLYKISDIEDVVIEFLNAKNNTDTIEAVSVLELNKHNLSALEELLDSRN